MLLYYCVNTIRGDIMEFNSTQPIYLQVSHDIKLKIINGTYKYEDKLSSVRDLAIEYGVNPNTIQRSMQELERENFVCSERTAGRFINATAQQIEECKLHMLQVCINTFIHDLKQLGLTVEDGVQALTKEKEI